MSKNGERFYEAELHRLKVQLVLQQSSDNASDTEGFDTADLIEAKALLDTLA